MLADPLIKFLWLRRKWLVAAVIIAVPIAVLLKVTLPKTYVVTNGLRIGKFMGVPLELAEYTQLRFKMPDFLADAYERANLNLDMAREDLPRTVKVSIENDFNKQSNIDTLIFSVKAPTAELAGAMSRALSDHLKYVHGQKLAQAQLIRDREIETWRQSAAEINEKISRTEDMFTRATTAQSLEATALFLLSSKLQEQQEMHFHMQQLLHRITLKNHNPVETFNTEMIAEVRAPEKAAFPKLILLLAGCEMLACFAWLFFNWSAFMWQAQISGGKADHNQTALQKLDLDPRHEAV